jgi:prevent-host-death family protein
MSTVNMLDAKTHLSKLVGDVESGAVEEVVIARNGKPAARLVPIGRARAGGKRLGLLAGRFKPMSLEDFNASDEAVAALFGGPERD